MLQESSDSTSIMLQELKSKLLHNETAPVVLTQIRVMQNSSDSTSVMLQELKAGPINEDDAPIVVTRISIMPQESKLELVNKESTPVVFVQIPSRALPKAETKLSTKVGITCGSAAGILSAGSGYLSCGLYGLSAAAIAIPAGLFGKYIFSICDSDSKEKVIKSRCQGFKARK